MQHFNRRRFLKGTVTALLAMLPAFVIGFERNKLRTTARRRFLRPPGALPEDQFLKQCIGCFKCATACPNSCIEMAGFAQGLKNVHTPMIFPRKQACTLCMRCTEVCPTGALQLVSRDKEVVAEKVKMGVAVIETALCFSYYGRTCGVCYRACPYPGKALSVGLLEQPVIDPDHCVGCGLCEQACIHMPQAIRIQAI